MTMDSFLKSILDAKTHYTNAYRAARLDVHIANSNQSFDYTMYDGFRDEGDGYNAQGQSIYDWRDSIDRLAYEEMEFGEHCKEIRASLNVDPALVELCRKHYYDARYVKMNTTPTRWRYGVVARRRLLQRKVVCSRCKGTGVVTRLAVHVGMWADECPVCHGKAV